MALCLCLGCVSAQTDSAVVYFTTEITPEALVAVFNALGVEPQGKVAVKISTGESEQSNQLRPDFIAPLVQLVNGNIVECNTAYGGNRSNTADHRRAIEQRGYGRIATVDIMDADGSMLLPMQDTTWFAEDIVGGHLADYDFMINLAHFKGHAMGGFGGRHQKPEHRYRHSRRQNVDSHRRCIYRCQGPLRAASRSGCFSRIDGRRGTGCTQLLQG